MFTGIVEETGTVVAFTQGADAWKLQIAARAALQDIAEWSYAHAPVSSTIASAPKCRVTIETGG